MPTADLNTTYEAIASGRAWRIVPRDGVIVSGPDASSWLQGQVTQDLDVLGTQASTETLVLSPQGKVDSYCRVTSIANDELLLDLTPGHGPALMERLRRFRLRVKVELRLVEGLRAVELRGTALPYLEIKGAFARAPVVWPPLVGEDVLWQGGDSELEDVSGVVSDALGTSAGDDAAFEAWRIEAGVPELGSELTERTIPQEAGQLAARTVSFTKGCYTGQELVARLDARGSNVAKRLSGVVVTNPGASPPSPGTELLVDGTPAGTLTSVAFSPGFGTHVALAYVARRVEVPGLGVLGATGDLSARVLPLPMEHD